MKAVILHAADEMRVQSWPVPDLGPGEVLLKVEVASICGTDVKVLHRKLQGQPEGQFIMGHEYAGTVAALGPGVDEFRVGDRVAVEVHKGCERCENCIKGWYTSCLNYGNLAKGHRAKGLTCDGGFAEYAVNHINTLVHVPDDMTDEEATLVVTAGTSMYGLDVLGGLIAGEGVVVTGPGPIGLLGVAVAKALGADPVILTGTRDARLDLGKRLGADHVVNARREDPVAAVKRITTGRGVHFVVECSGAPEALNEAAQMVNRGGRICLAAFPQDPVPVDLAYLVRNNIYVFGIRGEGQSATHRAMALMKQKRFDARLIHTHTFPLDELPIALKYARERIDDAIKVVVKAGL
jgi:L-iditol 2-dehydrogenase